MFFCFKCCVLLGKSLCDEPFTGPEESYRPSCVVVCGLKISKIWRPWPALGRSAIGKKNVYTGFNLRSLTRCTAESDETVWKEVAARHLNP